MNRFRIELTDAVETIDGYYLRRRLRQLKAAGRIVLGVFEVQPAVLHA